MFKKNSIYFKLLFPTIGIILVQSILIIVILYLNGSIKSMESTAVDRLDKNANNRANMLENTMIYKWSNLDEFETKVLEYFSDYAQEKGTTIDSILNQEDSKKVIDEMLNDLSEPALMALRSTQSTGIYLYFANNIDVSATSNECSGFYFRDFDPIYNPAQYTDVICLKGNVNISRKYSMALDNVWTEQFKFSTDHESYWNDCYKPFRAFSENSSLSSRDLSYWNEPHSVNLESSDPNKYITYNRPIIVEGKIVAMIGVEVQVKTLLSYIPYTDFDSSGQSGYMLLKYDENESTADKLECELYTLTGSYINRLVGTQDTLTLEKNKELKTYTISSFGDENVIACVQPIVLYNTNAPFSNEKWILASVSTEGYLFEDYKNLKVGVIGGSLLAFVLGVFMLMIAIKRFTKPLTSVISQIKSNSPDKPITVKGKIYEVALLCTTLNEMKARQKTLDIALFEERERYLIALESATDTFMEYDLKNDCFSLYYFSDYGEKSSFTSKKIEDFLKQLDETDICYPEDRQRLADFLNGNCSEGIEIRMRSDVFSHMVSTQSIENYYWLALKASVLRDENGNIKKIIGNIRQITDQKRAQIIEAEAKKHDPTTNFFKKDYGVAMLNNLVNEKNSNNDEFCTCFIYIQNIDLFEAHYGRVFSGVVLRNVCKAIEENSLFKFDILVRISNDLFMGIVSGSAQESLDLIRQVVNNIDNIYQGEKSNLRIQIYAGVVNSDNKPCSELIKNSNTALNWAVKKGRCVLNYSELNEQEKRETFKINYRPVSTSINVSKTNMLACVFDIFENTSNTVSAIMLILNLIGELFELDQIVVYDYDSDFKTNQVSYHWSKKADAFVNKNIIKVSAEDYRDFQAILSKNGTVEYKYHEIKVMAPGVQRLLDVTKNNIKLNAFCSVIYENGVPSGRILYKTYDKSRTWTEFETNNFYEITKVISAHISIIKSNSASKAKGEFLSNVSHEIRTPMNAIIGLTRIAKEKLGENENALEYLDKIDHSANYLLGLINDVLDMSRIESGKMTLENSPFSLKNLAEDLDLLMRSPIEIKRINFVINTQINDEFVLSDENRLRQVMINLLGNASKFTNAGGTIIMSITQLKSTKEKNARYRFAVKDTGIGIAQDKHKLIFAAFSQVDVSMSQNGTGLGLAISSSILNAFNSQIELKSKLNAGSEFSFVLELPVVDITTSDEVDSLSVDNEMAAFNGKRALIVEDNEINMEIAISILEGMLFEIDTAVNGREACDKFLQSQPGTYDIIFMDIKMPVMDGLAATREIRKNTTHPQAQTVPIIAMTANAFDEDMRYAIESGMNGHVSKPVDIKKLNSLIAQIFE